MELKPWHFFTRVHLADDRMAEAEAFERELISFYPNDEAEVIELITSWMLRMGLISPQDAGGFI